MRIRKRRRRDLTWPGPHLDEMLEGLGPLGRQAVIQRLRTEQRLREVLR